MDQVTFADVLQKSFIAMSMGGTDRITTLNIMVNIAMSFAVGMFIFYIYKKTYQGVLYQRSFNISLVLASIVTSLVIMTISGNLILSLGMVGALSIVRFRTPVKDSMDLIFLFWAISAGIANGVGYFNISIVGSILIAVIMLVLTRYGSASEETYLMVVQTTSDESDDEVIDLIKGKVDKMALKSKIISDHGSEITLEVQAPMESTGFLSDLQSRDGVNKVTIVAYDQDMSAA